LNYYRKLVKIRKANPTLQYGKYTLLDRDNPNVFSYTRELDGKKLLILLNFTEKEAPYSIDLSTTNAKIILNNYSNTNSIQSNTLRPYESVIMELK
jgi:oligo-1,6-glucosidase